MVTQQPEAPGEQRTRGELHSVLASDARRVLLAHLEDAPDETASLADLTDALVAAGDGSNEPTRERIRARLHHVDLPKLEAVGIVTHDAPARTVRYHGHPGLEQTGERWTVTSEGWA